MVRPVTFDGPEAITSVVKSAIAAAKGGVPIKDLESEVAFLASEEVDSLCSHQDLHDIVRSVKEIKIRKNQRGELVYILENDPKLSHITEMVTKQRASSKPRRNPKDHQTEVTEKRVKYREARSRNRRSSRHQIHARNRDMVSSDDSGNPSTETSSPKYKERYGAPTKIPPPKDRRCVQTPVVSNGQLIGDDFFLQLAIRNLQQPIWRDYKNGPLHAGLCVSGQTIRSCIKSLQEVDMMSNKLVILLGAEDIYQGRSALEIQEDYEELLGVLSEKFSYSTGAITLCTVPPLGNISWMAQPSQFIALRALNQWILNQASSNGYPLADFFSHFSTVHGQPKYELFQIEPRRVSGTVSSYLLFCEQGRRLAMTLLRHTIDIY